MGITRTTNEGSLFPLADALGVPLRVIKKAGGVLGLSAFVQLAVPVGPFKKVLKFGTLDSYLSPAGTTSVLVLSAASPCELVVAVSIDHGRNVLEALLLDGRKLDSPGNDGLILPKEWSRKLFLYAVRNAVLERYTAKVGDLYWTPTYNGNQWVQQYLLGREDGLLSSDEAMTYADGVDLGAIELGQYSKAKRSTNAKALVSDALSKARGNTQA